MGKKQHQKDKMYLTTTEWTTLYGGKKAAHKPGKDARADFRRLPFHCCSLSLQPFEFPYCCDDGRIFDLLSILPYLKKYGHHPLTGKPMEAKSLIKLMFHKNADGKYHCPVTFRVFNENSHIVAIKTTGNVYSFDAVERLNLKPKNFKDLITDEPFKRSDIITLQDPNQLDRFNMGTFHHLKHKLRVEDEETAQALKDPTFKIRTITPEMKHTLDALEKEYSEPEIKIKGRGPDEKATSKNAAHYSMGRVAASLTSTVGGPQTVNEAAVIDKDTLRYEAVKKKGYVRLHTNHGDLNIELHCDMTPRTCENFIILSKRGYYNSTVFHRSIRNFMIQGGDPTAMGTGGESAWGSPFKDEFKPNLVHQGRGMLSMANSGPNTNKSQFFITFRSCRHLDNKHSVFGRVVGGIDVLNTMEKVETDDKDKPLEEIKIENVTVFIDPYEEVDQKMSEDEEAQRREEELEASKVKGKGKAKATDEKQKVYRSGVGRYIPKGHFVEDEAHSIAGAKRVPPETIPDKKSTKKKAKSAFGDFSNW